MALNGTEKTGAPEPVRTLPTEMYFSLVRQFLNDQGSAFVRVTGVSMMPLLHHQRDGVVLVPPARVRPGDIVLFDRKNGRYALHRVIRMGKHGFSMAGDNQWHMEHDLPYDQIVGVVSAISRKGRLLSASKISMKMYALCARLFATPRIFLRQAAGKLLCPLLRWLRARGWGL